MGVRDQLIDKFLKHYGPPDTVAAEEVIADYVEAMDGTAADILAEAVKIILKQHTYRNWPTIGECCKVINEIAERRAAAARAAVDPDPYAHIPPPTPEQKAAVNALVADAISQIKRPR